MKYTTYIWREKRIDFEVYDHAAGALVAAEAGAHVHAGTNGSQNLTFAAAPTIADELAAMVGDDSAG